MNSSSSSSESQFENNIPPPPNVNENALKDIQLDNESREPFYIYLQNSILTNDLQRYIGAFVQHIASILEKNDKNSRRVVSFLPERNGILLFGFKVSTVKVIYKFLRRLDEEKHNLHFEVNLVLVESHKMTGGFQF